MSRKLGLTDIAGSRTSCRLILRIIQISSISCEHSEAGQIRFVNDTVFLAIDDVEKVQISACTWAVKRIEEACAPLLGLDGSISSQCISRFMSLKVKWDGWKTRLDYMHPSCI